MSGSHEIFIHSEIHNGLHSFQCAQVRSQTGGTDNKIFVSKKNTFFNVAFTAITSCGLHFRITVKKICFDEIWLNFLAAVLKSWEVI